MYKQTSSIRTGIRDVIRTTGWCITAQITCSHIQFQLIININFLLQLVNTHFLSTSKWPRRKKWLNFSSLCLVSGWSLPEKTLPDTHANMATSDWRYLCMIIARANYRGRQPLSQSRLTNLKCHSSLSHKLFVLEPYPLGGRDIQLWQLEWERRWKEG